MKNIFTEEFISSAFTPVVDENNNTLRYIDKLGRITQEPTESGIEYFLLTSGQIPFYKLQYRFFADDTFANGVSYFEKHWFEAHKNERGAIKKHNENLDIINKKISEAQSLYTLEC